MIENFKKIMNNVIGRLIMMGECCQTPGYLDNFLRTRPELPGSPNSKLLIDNLEKEMAVNGIKSKAAELEAKSALTGNSIGDEILVAK